MDKSLVIVHENNNDYIYKFGVNGDQQVYYYVENFKKF